jgi:hypothetical protein
LAQRENLVFQAIVARLVHVNLMHKPNAHEPPNMPKPYRPKGIKTYVIHPRVPLKYKDVVKGSHVTRSLHTQDFAEAKRRLHDAMKALYAEWDAKLAACVATSRAAEPSADPQGRITAREGVWFDSVEHACAYYYEFLREREQFLRLRARAAFTGVPEDDFFRGVMVPISKERRTALARKLKEELRSRRDDLEACFAVGDFAPVREFAARMFDERYLADEDFVLALAHTQMQFLDSLIASDAALYAFIDEVDGSFVLRQLGGNFPIVRVAQTVPNLSKFCDDYISERGSGLSGERADTLRAVVRDLIEITADKPLTDYGNADANTFKDVMLALPANWRKRKGVRELGMNGSPDA